MTRPMIFLAVCLLGICARPAAATHRLAISMIWHKRADAKPVWHRHPFGTLKVAELVKGGGLTVAFVKERNQLFAGVLFKGEFQRNAVASAGLSELHLLLKDPDQEDVSWTTTIFSEKRAFGTHAPDLGNVYHIAFLNGSVEKAALPTVPVLLQPHRDRWQKPFLRTRRLAVNYAVQSDSKTRELAELFGVETSWQAPRIIVASEEWITLKEEQRKAPRKNAGGLFGGVLDDVAGEIEGKEKKLAPKRFPVYSIDVLRNDIESTGQWATGFQTARSVWNDVLEGKVIAAATGPTRRVLTATGVLCQLAKNRQQGKSKNRLLKITKKTFPLIYKLPDLNAKSQASIAAFLLKNPDSHVVIPAAPVVMYEGDKPLYAVYAYYRVHPDSGRMVGMLTNDNHGAVSDELARLEDGLLKRIKGKVGSGGAPVKMFFSQVAGMYVSSAGMLDGISLTIANPELANMDGDQWKEFMADNCLDFCQQFLEDNADMYDSYEALIGFWQGSIPLVGEYGGVEAAKKAVDHALTGVRDKAINDVKSHFEEKAKELGGAAKKDAKALFDKTMGEYAPNVRKAAEAAKAVKDAHDSAVAVGDQVNDYRARGEAVWNELEGRFRN